MSSIFPAHFFSYSFSDNFSNIVKLNRDLTPRKGEISRRLRAEKKRYNEGAYNCNVHSPPTIARDQSGKWTRYYIEPRRSVSVRGVRDTCNRDTYRVRERRPVVPVSARYTQNPASSPACTVFVVLAFFAVNLFQSIYGIRWDLIDCPP